MVNEWVGAGLKLHAYHYSSIVYRDLIIKILFIQCLLGYSMGFLWAKPYFLSFLDARSRSILSHVLIYPI